MMMGGEQTTGMRYDDDEEEEKEEEGNGFSAANRSKTRLWHLRASGFSFSRTWRRQGVTEDEEDGWMDGWMDVGEESEREQNRRKGRKIKAVVAKCRTLSKVKVSEASW